MKFTFEQVMLNTKFRCDSLIFSEKYKKIVQSHFAQSHPTKLCEPIINFIEKNASFVQSRKCHVLFSSNTTAKEANLCEFKPTTQISRWKLTEDQKLLTRISNVNNFNRRKYTYKNK